MPLTVRAAVPSELAAVGDLCVAAYAPFLGDKDHYVATLRATAGRAHDAELMVAADGDALLGTVTFVPSGGPVGEIAALGEAEFRMLAVDPAAQGRGVGGALLGHVLDASRALGRTGVVCSSLPQMRAAHRLYARAGFTRAPERDWSPVPGVALLAFAVRL